MQGFNSEFANLTDYILKITERIWEGRQVDKIREWYGATAPVYTPTSATSDVERVIQFTLETLHMFPDRQLLGEDVIGCESKLGLHYSSHRILSPMTHRGSGFFGLPSGNKVKARIIADCICQNNQIIEEWMVRDQAAIIEQVGLDTESFARQLSASWREAGIQPELGDKLVQRWRGGPASAAIAEPKHTQLIDNYCQLWQGNQLALIPEIYDRAACVHGPAHHCLNGHSEIDNFLCSYQASLKNPQFSLEHSIVKQEPGQPTRIALRWSLAGTHGGNGHFAEPSGKDLVIMAITHLELRDSKILREYLLIDELSLWLQIHA